MNDYGAEIEELSLWPILLSFNHFLMFTCNLLNNTTRMSRIQKRICDFHFPKACSCFTDYLFPEEIKNRIDEFSSRYSILVISKETAFFLQNHSAFHLMPCKNPGIMCNRVEEVTDNPVDYYFNTEFTKTFAPYYFTTHSEIGSKLNSSLRPISQDLIKAALLNGLNPISFEKVERVSVTRIKLYLHNHLTKRTFILAGSNMVNFQKVMLKRICPLNSFNKGEFSDHDVRYSNDGISFSASRYSRAVVELIETLVNNICYKTVRFSLCVLDDPLCPIDIDPEPKYVIEDFYKLMKVAAAASVSLSMTFAQSMKVAAWVALNYKDEPILEQMSRASAQDVDMFYISTANSFTMASIVNHMIALDGHSTSESTYKSFVDEVTTMKQMLDTRKLKFSNDH